MRDSDGRCCPFLARTIHCFGVGVGRIRVRDGRSRWIQIPHPTTWTLLSALGISNPARLGHKPTMTPTFCHITIQCDEHDGIWPTDCTILRCFPSVCDDSECARPTHPDSPRTSPPANSEDQTWKPTMKPMHRATDANNINVRSSNGGTEDANTGRCEGRLTYECAKGLPLREMIESWP